MTYGFGPRFTWTHGQGQGRRAPDLRRTHEARSIVLIMISSVDNHQRMGRGPHSSIGSSSQSADERAPSQGTHGAAHTIQKEVEGEHRQAPGLQEARGLHGVGGKGRETTAGPSSEKQAGPGADPGRRGEPPKQGGAR